MTGQEVEVRDRELLADVEAIRGHTPLMPMPWTGELIDLREPASVCDALDKVRTMKRRLDELRSLLETVLRLESNRQGTKTLHVQGGLTATISGGQKTSYDAEALALELEEAGLPRERVVEAVRPVVEWKVDQRVLKQLAGANPEYAEIIERHRRLEPDYWRVSVKRS